MRISFTRNASVLISVSAKKRKIMPQQIRFNQSKLSGTTLKRGDAIKLENGWKILFTDSRWKAFSQSFIIRKFKYWCEKLFVGSATVNLNLIERLKSYLQIRKYINKTLNCLIDSFEPFLSEAVDKRIIRNILVSRPWKYYLRNFISNL